MAKVSHDGVLALEPALLRVPTERARYAFRVGQRTLDSGVAPIAGALRDAAKAAPTGSREETLKTLDAQIAKMNSMETKISEAWTDPANGLAPALERLDARMTHLNTLERAQVQTDIAYEQFTDTRLDRHIVDYMFRTGYRESAIALTGAREIEPLTDGFLFDELARIDADLERHSCIEALAWCKDASSALKKIDVG